MPVTCIVPGCTSRADKGDLSYYRVPTIKTSKYRHQSNQLSIKRQQMWLAAINRDDLTESILRNQRVCSKHFIYGKPSPLNDIDSPDWVPSQNMGNTTEDFSRIDLEMDMDNKRKKRRKPVIRRKKSQDKIPDTSNSRMDIDEAKLETSKNDSEVKAVIPKEEPSEKDSFIKCEICKEYSTSDCVHHKKEMPSLSDKQFEIPKLDLADLQTNSVEDVKPEAESTDSSSAKEQAGKSIAEVNEDIKVKEEICFDSPDYALENDLECDTGRVKTEVEDDSFCKNFENDSVSNVLEQETGKDSAFSSVPIDERFSAESSSSQEKIHDEANPFSCKFCSESFFSSTALTIHAKIHNGERPFQCKICSKSFGQRYSLTMHERIHNGEKPFVCQYCPKAFTNNAYLVVHVRTHTGEKPFQCQMCSKAFAERGSLIRHERIHNGERPYVCGFCSKAFINSSALVIHSRMHTGEKPFQCEICLRSFSCRNGLVRHGKIHSGEKPYVCEHCSKCFSGRSELVVHIRTHTGELYPCKFCPKFFNRPYDVTIHERTHTGEKPHKCKECSKSFVNNSALVVHLRSHTGEKPYKCQVCSKAYTTSSNLVVHTRIHTAEILGPAGVDMLLKDQL